MRRQTGSLAVICIASLGVLAVSLQGLRGERQAAETDFLARQQALLREAASDVEGLLTSLDEDVRLLVTMVQRTTAVLPREAASRGQVLEAELGALVSAVRPYRRIALVGADGVERTAIVDAAVPEHAMASAVVDAGRAAAAEALRTGRPAVMSLARVGGTTHGVIIHALPTGTGDAVALAVDGSLLLESGLRQHAEQLRFLIFDPYGNLWTGCQRATACVALPRPEWSSRPGLARVAGLASGPDGADWDDQGLSEELGLPAGRTALTWKEVRTPAAGRWTLALVTATDDLRDREAALVRQMLLTSGALLLAVLLVGWIIVRQQRAAVALQERLRHAQELAALRARSQTLIENVPVGILGVDAKGQLSLANSFIHTRAGRVNLGVPIREALPEVAPPLRARLDDAIGATLATHQPALLRAENFQRDRDPPGHLDVHVIPMGEPTPDLAVLIMAEDLTEVRRLESQLVRAEKLSTVGVLTAGIAHEVGTPLGIIRGRAETLLERMGQGTGTRDLTAIIQQIDRIAGIIRQLLDFASAQPVQSKRIDAAVVVQSVVDLLSHRFRARAVQLLTELAEPLPTIAANPDQLQQVLINLLLNACDACERGGQVHVRVRPERAEVPRLVFQVADTGCGIPAEHLNAVFDPFFTTKKRGEGTGLGLPVAASIIRNHGGEIMLDSTPGAGTTVTVSWPTRSRDKELEHEQAARADRG